MADEGEPSQEAQQEAQEQAEQVAEVVKAGTDTTASVVEIQALVAQHRFARLDYYARRENWTAAAPPPQARTDAEVRQWWAEWRELQLTQAALPFEAPVAFEAAAPPAMATPP